MSLSCVPDEIIKNEIISYLDARSKLRFALTSKLICKLVGVIKENQYSLYEKNQDIRRKRMVKLRYNNDLWKLIKEYPDPSKFANIPNAIGSLKNKWDWTNIYMNSNLTWEIFLDIITNYDKTEMLEDQFVPVSWYLISSHRNITWDIIQENLDVPKKFGHNWYWPMVSQNPNITWDIIQANLDKFTDWEMISQNPNITWDIIIKNPNIPWNFYDISCNLNITFDIIQANLDYPKKFKSDWDRYEISKRSDITWDIIIKNPKFLWNWMGISDNPNITWDIIQANLDYPKTFGSDWYWFNIYTHPNITWKMIQKFPENKQDFVAISCNPNITWKIVLEAMHKPWSIGNLSRNPCTTYEFIKNNLYISWHWNAISGNTFGTVQKMIIIKNNKK